MVFISPPAWSETRIRAHLEPSEGAYQGQQVQLIVELETDTWFTTAPRYPEIHLSGAIILQPDVFAVNSTRTEGTTTWTGQRQRYVIFPQRPGELAIPSFEVSFATATDGSPDPESSLTTPALSTVVLSPPGSEDVGRFITTASFELQESWDGELTKLVVGDALIRTVTRTAQGTFALMFPPVEFETPQSVTAYTAPPRLDDLTNRGRYTATRVDAVTYVIQESGTIDLPAIDLYWFDPVAGVMNQERLDPVTLEVEVNPAALFGEGESATIKERTTVTLGVLLVWLKNNLIWLTLLIAGVWLAREIWRRINTPLTTWWLNRRHERKFGEPAYYRRVVDALGRDDPTAFVGAFWAWTDRLPSRTAPLSADELPLDVAKEGWRAFEQSRYGRNETAVDASVPADARQSVRNLRRRWFGKEVSEEVDPLTLNP
jgi:hypothetical protein